LTINRIETLEKIMDKKYVMVDAISQFRMRYVVEIPEKLVSNCTPKEYAKDTVTVDEAVEFSQKHLAETILSSREMTQEQVIDQCRQDNPEIGENWSDRDIVENFITKV
tara:strand:+ start:905 stop:1231 length:327 start_codon:yes stop_codon:yes gene_type:complete